MRDILIRKPEFLLALDITGTSTRKISLMPLTLESYKKPSPNQQIVLMKSEALENDNKKPFNTLNRKKE